MLQSSLDLYVGIYIPHDVGRFDTLMIYMHTPLHACV